MAQRTRPVIGINADFIAAGKHTEAHARLNAGYFDAVLAAGGLPLVMPPLNKDSEINAFLDHVDGFLLSGGLDMDPRRSGQPTHSAVQPMAERREFNRWWLKVDLEAPGHREPHVTLRFAGEAMHFGNALPAGRRIEVAQALRRLTASR